MKKRKRKRTKHHNLNYVRGGGNDRKNIIMLIEEKHECWHTLFGNKTFIEAARLLFRADKMKRGVR